MISHAEGASPRLKITKNEFGYSIKVTSKSPANKYTPPDRKEVSRALREANKSQGNVKGKK
jgi:hypothetical protein